MLTTATKSPAGASVKHPVEIQTLLEWAFRSELPKRQLSAQEARWVGMEVSGPFGPVDEGSVPQRYAYVGAPHRDAVAIEAAVSGLPLVEIDWEESLDAIMGDLAPLVSINDLRREREEGGRVTQSSWPAKQYSKSGGRGRSINVPRDILLVGSLQPAELVACHAKQGTRPRWYPQLESCHPTPARNHPGQAMITGESWGRNRYSTGAHCPLTWRPSPIKVAQCRADYIAWWRGLTILAETLELRDHVALPPVAPRLPWFDPEPSASLFGQSVPPKMRKLPLKPDRPIAGRTRGQGEDVKRAPRRRVAPHG